jgi:hypothetical protein
MMPADNTLLEYLTDPSPQLPQPRGAEGAAHEILQILAQLEREGGATYSLYFGDQFGEPFYAVALDNRLTQRLPDPVDPSDAILGFLEMHRDLLMHPRCSVGVWTGADPDGVEMLFLDITVLVYNEPVARDFGAQGNQIAIFDLKRGVEIDTGGTGLPVPGTRPPRGWLQLLDSADRVETTGGEEHDDTDRS